MGKASSLVTRLTLLMGVTLTVIWLILIATTAFFSYENTRQILINELTHMASMRADLSNHQFEGAERDAASLISRRESLQSTSPLPEISIKHYDSYYIPFNLDSCNINQHKNDLWIIQAYGTAGQTYYLDSFIIKQKEGIVLFPPQKSSSDYLNQRRKDLLLLPKFPTHNNIYWGAPTYTPQGGWHVSVAVCDKVGTLAGFALKLNDLIAYNHPVEQRDINLLLDKNGELLPISQQATSSNQLHEILNQLKNSKLHDGWQQTPDYLVLRTQLKGPGWQQLVIYPRMGFAWEALKPALYQLPFALAILLLLTSVLSLLLRYYLAIPLWNFINIIGATGPQAMEPRLPINRIDELGHIARAYNNLLDTLNEQYDTLEMKVKERTLALAEAKRAAEQANRRKSDHLTTISHEIRTPLNGALGAVELLQNTPLDAGQMRLAETAHQCSLSLLAIINNLLDFSRIESGQMTLSLEKTALLPLLDQAMLTIHSQALSKSLALSTFISANIPLELELDTLRLRQILVNLLGNAVKFTPQGRIQLRVRRQNQTLCFTVEDTGCGIDVQHQQTIFQPFMQTSDHEQGTGLGLAIADNLAKMMGGHLTVFSEPGQGSCFSLCLPFNAIPPPMPFHGELFAPQRLHAQLSAWGMTCQPELANQPSRHFVDNALCYLPGRLYAKLKQYLQGAETEALKSLPLQPWQMHILLVDDSETNRDITGMMLQQLGHQVTRADSGTTALAIGRQHRFDLVLMDIRMPVLDGLATTARWRHDPANIDSHCMITALSANASPDEQIKTSQAGMNHYLSKPVTLGQLAEMLDLTAQFQLERGVDLSPQLSEPQPLLDLADSALSLKLYQSLQVLIQQAKDAIENLPVLSHTLHTIKGCAGQAGLIELQDAVIQLEHALDTHETLTQQEIIQLDEIIHVLLQPPTTCESTFIISQGQSLMVK
ncbi:two component system sensor kinase [Yersinia pestis]|uniref:two component system sensor kinase n=1 Tax=Yersinia pestis TaxID=632 RepID=UPI00097604D7|nr:two component system sensor kinase [Yersinia pestis]OML11638.1 hybrid sensor histidine kinase/response regulator [Yersinia pestis subsp. microtus bv. Altaica]OVY64275.1 hybrid sensor histidine kinase/response regulator [Yersinia pestis subsp. microtus bv. Altaica]OVY81827.1 hybrid sensor histidine kinase/response regulator [Yersinia pestis subsp. microtus bv. Xilingolensis]